MNEELEVTQNPVETQEAVVEQPEQPSIKESQREINFRAMRERAERAEQRARELEAMAQRERAGEPEPEDDGFIEGRTFKKYTKSQKELEEKLEKTQKQLEYFSNTSIEIQLRSKFSDFDKVVTDENMERLKAEKPGLYRSILHNPDLRDKGETAYDAISTYLQPDKYKAQEKRLEENKAKPKSSSTISPQTSDSPLARAGDYDRRTISKDRRAELYREMQEFKRGY